MLFSNLDHCAAQIKEFSKSDLLQHLLLMHVYRRASDFMLVVVGDLNNLLDLNLQPLLLHNTKRRKKSYIDIPIL
jgi:hypothetical protein